MGVPDARARGWGWPGKVGSTQEQAFRRDHIVTITAGGVRLAVHREAAPLFQGFCDEIAARGYPLGKVADDWGFANRPIRGYPDDDNPAHKSNHAWGLAVDLNATTNPMTSDGKTHTDMPPWVVETAASWGLSWGGNYVGSRRDPMHFEVLGTPEDVARALAMHKKPYQNAGTAALPPLAPAQTFGDDMTRTPARINLDADGGWTIVPVPFEHVVSAFVVGGPDYSYTGAFEIAADPAGTKLTLAEPGNPGWVDVVVWSVG